MDTQQKAQLLQQIIDIINPREKATTDRMRVLNGRLKDYEPDEIIGSAIAFSKSQWHKDNHQMSVDNLLAPSKFGRWYLLRENIIDTAAKDSENERWKRFENAESEWFRQGKSLDDFRKKYSIDDF